MYRNHDGGCVETERKTSSDRDMDCVETIRGTVWIPRKGLCRDRNRDCEDTVIRTVERTG